LTRYYDICEYDEPEAVRMTATDVASYIQGETKLRVSPIGIGKALAKLKFLKIFERRNGTPRSIYLLRPTSAPVQ